MRTWLERAGFDARFTSLLLALAIIWGALAFATGGIFVTPRNLYNLSIQTCVTAIMACGMVYVIAARQIDLSVGSQMAFTGMLIAIAQTDWLGADSSWGWLGSIAIGIAAGMALGAFQGWWTAYRAVPAFVVTLAGYLMFRGAAFMVADGQTLAPLATPYQRLGGGVNGSIGPLWSWLLGFAACAWVVAQALQARRSRARFNATMPPAWATGVKVAVSCAAVLGFVAVMNAYPDPASTADGGAAVGKGIGLPVLILVFVAIALTILAQRTRFGRYVFAYGGNPEAALLSGLPTKRILLYVFVLMGALAAISAVITTSRLNAGTHSIGQMAELYVIAAAVIGGTSLAGGVGTIPGAIVGAVIIQSLDNGMVLMDVSSAKRQIFIGAILIAAVWFDGIYSKRQSQ
ncbi:sugar ABC transporter permease [Usitatibacter palustris]|uniref:Xylose transport system permease protein XylH n=1 Tax=Usitatibacter palustris TaxID=2732487 RepID=A0A6M4H775_9PROT|nr:sugar ABC transporter permease [Usitatibacter palustris]QJR15232.1 Xylose transport system permease protein XylH [Usitatibacter palustris]